jgi:hypothetical protein
VTLLVQDTQRAGFAEGMDLGVAYLLVNGMRDEAVAQKVELVSGRKESHCSRGRR